MEKAADLSWGPAFWNTLDTRMRDQQPRETFDALENQCKMYLRELDHRLWGVTDENKLHEEVAVEKEAPDNA